MPAKPEVYYMPSNLTVVGNTEFQDCKHLNNFIVFPQGVTSMSDCGQGSFCGIGIDRTTPVTLVFLGDVTDIIIRQNNSNSKNIHFVFANPNDKDMTSLDFIVGAANNVSQTNSYAYFCASNSVYDLSTFIAPNSTKYTIQEGEFTKTVNTAGTQPHFRSPRLDATLPATCELPAGTFTFCFCGDVMSKDVVEGSVALGHIKGDDLLIHYPVSGDIIDFFQDAIHSFTCQREECGKAVNETKKGTALFTEKGYSKEEYVGGNAFTYGIKLDKDAEKAYVDNGNTISYGFIIGAETREGTNGNIINANGTTNLQKYVLTDFAESSYKNFSIYNVRMFGLANDQLTKKVYCCAYVINNGEVYYVGESVTKTAVEISYDAIKPVATTTPSDDETQA